MVKKFVFIALSVILFAGCNSNELEFDDIQLPSVQGTFSLPLGEVTYTIRDLIDQQEDSLLDLQVDEDSLITLAYYDSISYESNTDFIQIDDITEGGAISLSGVPGTPISGAATIPLAESFSLDYNPSDTTDVIDSIFYATGDVTVEVTSDIDGTIDYSFTLNNFVTTFNEVPLELNGTLNGNGTPTTSMTQRSLLNHKAILSGTDNIFSTDFSADITLSGAQTFNGTESLTFNITFANQTFSIVYGKFGQDTIQVGSESLDVALFKEMGEEGLFFGNPILRFNFENTIGTPVGIDFSGLFGNDGEGGDSTFLSGDVVDNIPIVASGDINDPGPAVATTIEITKGNSSIVDLLATSPGLLGFDVSAISNPDDPNQINFISTINQINASIEIEIPLEVKLENMQQTINLDLGGGLDISDVDSAFMRVLTINEMPFSALLSMDIQDEDSNSMYMIAEELVLAAPFIDINGFVTDPNGNTVDIPLTKAAIDSLGVASHIAMTVTGNTPGSLNSRDIFVKILSDYALEVSVGIQGIVNVDL